MIDNNVDCGFEKVYNNERMFIMIFGKIFIIE